MTTQQFTIEYPAVQRSECIFRLMAGKNPVIEVESEPSKGGTLAYIAFARSTDGTLSYAKMADTPEEAIKLVVDGFKKIVDGAKATFDAIDVEDMVAHLKAKP